MPKYVMLNMEAVNNRKITGSYGRDMVLKNFKPNTLIRIFARTHTNYGRELFLATAHTPGAWSRMNDDLLDDRLVAIDEEWKHYKEPWVAFKEVLQQYNLYWIDVRRVQELNQQLGKILLTKLEED